jgi:hypothetical protein
MPGSHLIAEESWSVDVALIDVGGLDEALVRSFGECHSERCAEAKDDDFGALEAFLDAVDRSRGAGSTSARASRSVEQIGAR